MEQQQIGKTQSKESKYVCVQMAGQCAFASPPVTAREAFKRKPYYMFNSKLYEEQDK